MSPRHIILPEHRHALTPEERGHRPRVSPGEPSRDYKIRVGQGLWNSLRLAGADTVRRWLAALCRWKT